MTDQIFPANPWWATKWATPWLALATAAPLVWQSLRPVERTVAQYRFPVVQSHAGWRKAALSIEEVAAIVGMTREEVRHAETVYLAAFRHPATFEAVERAVQRILSRD